MLGDHWCRTCGNELDRMSSSRWGCVSCYVASGPDWQSRWLADCAVAARERAGTSVIPFRTEVSAAAAASSSSGVSTLAVGVQSRHLMDRVQDESVWR